jgi:D-Tyr-tRNA(Tyr) deacylase
VSQFTLLASTKKGTKPDFHAAASGPDAKAFYELFVSKVRAGYDSESVKDGVFQAMMQVALVNDGPVEFTHSFDAMSNIDVQSGYSRDIIRGEEASGDHGFYRFKVT